MYYNKWTIKNIIENILGKEVDVKYTYTIASEVHQTLFMNAQQKIINSKIRFFSISLQETEHHYTFSYLPINHQKLFSKYDLKLWVILHEIGHTKTMKGLSFTQYNKDREKLQDFMKSKSQHEFNVFYRKTTPERRADKWAYEWAIKHPKECECISENLRISKS